MAADAPEWQEIEEGLNGNTVALFRNEHGDKLEVRDTWPNAISLNKTKKDRYKVVYEPRGRFPATGPEADFDDPRKAMEYAVETVIGENYDKYVREGL